MSSIYIQEPPTFGKVLLKTTVGDIDIELWSKEAPKACRNFIQLCLEGYYNGTVFHRVVKEFIVQGGDPTGTGEGGESVYGHPFKDEFHSRLRFCRRGLVAMANAGKDDNASQFFFTMAACQELQNKHTIFGKVTGDTVYNMLKLQEGVIDHNERPQFPQKITKTTVLDNPFPDIVSRVTASGSKEGKRKREKKSGVKDFKLLSFGEEAEEDEEETERENKRFSGRSKSTHDILNDPKLSSMPAVQQTSPVKENSDSSDLSEDDNTKIENKSDDEVAVEVDRVRSKLQRHKKVKKEPVSAQQDDEDIEAYTLGQDKRDERKRQAEAIKKEYKDLKRNMRKQDKEELKEETDDIKNDSEVFQKYQKEKEEYEIKKKSLPAKGSDRESFTLALLEKFQKKLRNVKEQADEDEKVEQEQEELLEEDDADLGKDGGLWMARKLHFENKAAVLAKDANTRDEKAEEWLALDDPRNPINQRRRQAHTKSTTSRSKH